MSWRYFCTMDEFNLRKWSCLFFFYIYIYIRDINIDKKKNILKTLLHDKPSLMSSRSLNTLFSYSVYSLPLHLIGSLGWRDFIITGRKGSNIGTLQPSSPSEWDFLLMTAIGNTRAPWFWGIFERLKMKKVLYWNCFGNFVTNSMHRISVIMVSANAIGTRSLKISLTLTAAMWSWKPTKTK